ncbi:hypothetical protein LTR10_012625 [Elasticomyces elasticus]|uniref:Sodium/calcium exchanger membrane region domain-containing protein n=1 Tax=Exophiala sideris TaxID=1016849 RepID=A0ABR0JSC3_9EURO|nr:hypothetical protein LTR10_012625 [Elasticomyces elasticus]KAK5040174.1 hypothetical protein LTS07_000671 [Exophiala sideris]KAK5068552.1 hypothetical protein LTR69_000672 [Exophiala sideris]KAK5186150.1 hypothetical protein LTR44_001205 [Eurotiomycetes sp. CCFEE 6388]
MTKTTTIISTNTDPSTNALLYPLCTFLLSLYTLEHSTSLFINSTARIAHRLRISETLISLLTAGAEWEELFVVVAALIQNRPRLALGNVLGSCIGNILGAFSLGILVQSGIVKFDASAKRYAIVLFAVTTAIVLVWALGQVSTRPVGVVLVVAFGIYVAAVGWSIYRGVLAAPEDSDSDSDSDSESSTLEQEPDESGPDLATTQGRGEEGVESDESVALLGRRSRQPRRILWDVTKLIVGFIALSMSGYILSHSSRLLAARFEISESVFGATLLSLATTLPEKFVAVAPPIS